MGFRNPTTSLPADAITAGALPAGVTIVADQVEAGILTGSKVRTAETGRRAILSTDSTPPSGLLGTGASLELWDRDTLDGPALLGAYTAFGGGDYTVLTAPDAPGGSPQPAYLALVDGTTADKRSAYLGAVGPTDTNALSLLSDLSGFVGPQLAPILSWLASGAVTIGGDTDLDGLLNLTPAAGDALRVQGNPIAYAVAAGTGSVTVTASNQGTATITPGWGSRFPVAPLVFAVSGTSSYVMSISARTTTGFDVTARHIDGTVASSTPSFAWLAFLITRASAAG